MEEIVIKLLVALAVSFVTAIVINILAENLGYTKTERNVNSIIQTVGIFLMMFLCVTFSKYRVDVGGVSFRTDEVIYLEDGSIHFTPQGHDECVTIKDGFVVTQIKD